MVEVRLFGSIEVTIDGLPMRRLRNEKGLLVLAKLVVSAGKALDLGEIAASVWPSIDRASGVYHLQRVLTDLREALGPDSCSIHFPTATSVALEPEAFLSDMSEFLRLLERDVLGAIDSDQWYRAPFMADLTDPWVVRKRGQFQYLYVESMIRAAKWFEDRGQFDKAAQALTRLCQDDPFNESLLARVTSLFERAGMPSSASDLIKSAELERTQKLGLSGAEDTITFGAGTHPEATSSPPSDLTSPDQKKLKALVGRESEVQAIRHLLRHSRMVTLVGFGGIGKTRVAREIEVLEAGNYPDGCRFVPLASVRGKDQALLAVSYALRELDPDPSGMTSDLPIRLRDVSALVILDNCEHVFETISDLCRAFLTYGPHIKILATSQRRLAVAEETVFPLGVLPLPSDHELPLPLDLQSASVQLFAARARQAKPSLAINAQTIELIHHICRRLEGIPLAIELAASRVRLLTLSQIDELLGEHLELLSIPSEDHDPRHRTLDAALAWSFGLLGLSAQETLLSASLFAGNWCIDDLRALISQTTNLELVKDLDILVDRFLVLEGASDDTPRFHILEPVRYFCNQLLDGRGQLTEMRRRHMNHVLSVIEGSNNLTTSIRPVEADRTLALLDDEIHAAFAFTMETEDVRSAMSIVTNTWDYYWVRGKLEIARTRAERVVAMAGAELQKELYASSLWTAGVFSGSQADYDASAGYLNRAYQEYEKLGHEFGMARCLISLGQMYRNQGLPDRAEPIHRTSLALWEKIGNWRYQATEWGNIGIVEFDRGNFDLSREALEKALAISQSEGLVHMEMSSHLNLARTIYALDEFTEAESHFAIAEEMAKELNIVILGVMVGNYRSYLDFQTGNLKRAAKSLQEGLETFIRVGEKRGIAVTLEAVGLLGIQSGNIEDGVKILGGAKKIRDSIRSHPSPTENSLILKFSHPARLALGDLYLEVEEVGKYLDSLELLELAKKITRGALTES
jgi:predicted ATPase/DNA-binding SARP family transcriptional activator